MSFTLFLFVQVTLIGLYGALVISSPAEYEYFPGVGLYKLVNVSELRNWSEAFEDCRRDGGHLLVINNQEEADTVSYIVNRPGYTGDRWWIGVHDLYQSGRFYDIKGNSFADTGYTNWNPDYPVLDEQYGGHCLELDPNMQILNIPCNYTRAYLCEIEISSQYCHKNCVETVQ